MEGVKEFYLRNSDGTFILDYVITPTLTLDIPKYERVAGGSGTPNIFDSTGQFFSQAEITYNPDPELAYFGATAVIEAARISPKYDFNGPAFDGVLHVDVYESNQSGPSILQFAKPPQVRFVGGNIDSNGIPDPNFEEAQAVAKLDENGFLKEIEITNTGGFYYSVPKVHLNGVEYSSNYVRAEIGRTVVSGYLLPHTHRLPRESVMLVLPDLM